MDLRTRFFDMERGADWLLDSGDLSSDAALETAVILSLFTDARALDDDALPLGQSDRRGWWGDTYPVTPGDRIGSRLWLLAASKQLQAALNDAKAYAEEALAWLVSDGIAANVAVATFIARDEVMGMQVTITRPTGVDVAMRYDLLWSQLDAL